MQASPTLTDPDRALASSAHQLQRAAGTLQAHSGNPDAVPTHAITLAHAEEALDRLAVAMGQMASAVAEWCGERGAIVEENVLPPEARALRWHLQAAADILRESEAAFTTSREWARRLAAVSATDEDAEASGPDDPTI
jgi:hypothetical protein